MGLEKGGFDDDVCDAVSTVMMLIIYSANSITILTTCMANRPMVVRPIHECRLQKLAIGGMLRLRESHTVRKPMTMAGTARMWNTWTTKERDTTLKESHLKKICGLTV